MSTLGRLYPDGEVVVRQGESGECMYVVQEGRVEVLLEGPEGEKRIDVVDAGDFFGEMALFDREVRSATVRALGPARILTVDKKTLLRRVQEDPSLAFNVLERMSQRIRMLHAAVPRQQRSDGPTGGGEVP